jgi:hypothetical protein
MSVKDVVARKARQWAVCACDLNGTSERGDELHVDFLACVVRVREMHTGKIKDTDEVTQAGTVATLGSRREEKACKQASQPTD